MTDLSQPTFSIVVPTFQRPRVLARTLDALLATEYPTDRFEIIIVDDGNDPETRAVVGQARAGAVRTRLLPGAGRGAAAARNQGAQEASGDFVVFVDDDILVPPRHLLAQLEVRAVYGDCISGADWWEFSPDVASDLRMSPIGRYRLALEQSYRKPGARRWSVQAGLATAHLTLRRDHFNDLGGFDERFPRAGVEDWEFCLRARERGHALILDNRLLLLHNDRRLTLSQLCLREEWRGVSVGVLARLRCQDYEHTEVVRENSPVRPGDPVPLRLRKRIKWILGARILLAGLHRSVGALEPVLRPEALLHRLYTAVISVHYLRGFRAGFSSRSCVEGTGDGEPVRSAAVERAPC